MASEPNKRHTLLDLRSLKGSQLSPPSPEPHSEAPHPEPNKPKGSNAETLRKRRNPFTEGKSASSLRNGRFLSRNGDDTDPKTGFKDLQIVKAANAGIPSTKLVRMKHGSPGDRFEKVYRRKLDTWVTFALRKGTGEEETVMLKKFSDSEAAKKVDMLQQIRHGNFVTFLEYYNFDGCHHVILEHMDISAITFAQSVIYPTELQLAKIFAQVVRGLVYLTENGISHSNFDASFVLFNRRGDVKITGQEWCFKDASPGKTSPRTLRELGKTMVLLMQKYTNGDTIGVEDLARWPSDSNVVDFLSMITSVTSFHELTTHALLESDWQDQQIGWMVEVAMCQARIDNEVVAQL